MPNKCSRRKNVHYSTVPGHCRMARLDIGGVFNDHNATTAPILHWRLYRVGRSESRPDSEVKRRRARLVLGWGTAREDLTKNCPRVPKRPAASRIVASESGKLDCPSRVHTVRCAEALQNGSARYGMARWRPYRVECTGSLPNSEVKRRRARLVLGWGTDRPGRPYNKLPKGAKTACGEENRRPREQESGLPQDRCLAYYI